MRGNERGKGSRCRFRRDLVIVAPLSLTLSPLRGARGPERARGEKAKSGGRREEARLQAWGPRADPLPPTCGRRPLSPAGTSGPSRPAPAPAASPRPRRCAGEAIWPLPRAVSGPKRRGFKHGGRVQCARTLSRRPAVGGLSRCAGEAIWPLPRPVSGPKRRGFKHGGRVQCARTLSRRPAVGGLSRCAGEAIWPLPRPGPVQGDEASSMGSGVSYGRTPLSRGEGTGGAGRPLPACAAASGTWHRVEHLTAMYFAAC